jgi:peptide/nickel transport system substrate-binding protein
VRKPLNKRSLVVLGAVLAVGAAVVVAASAATSGKTARTAAPGGTLNVGWEQSFGALDNFDPTGEYLGNWQGIATNLLIRTLVGYPHLPGGPGNVLIPDIATVVPSVANGGISKNGLTYTFHLKTGIKFGPPLNRAVTSADFVTALKRLADPNDGQEYGFYYTPIQGFTSGKGKTLSGVSTPNASTLVIHLTQPTGDFLYRMAMPATGPMPASITDCFEGQAGKYGQDLVSTGPYMIAGMDKVTASPCSAIKPASGFDGSTIYDLVRNPDYNPSTDHFRKNYIDEFKFMVDASADDIYNKIDNGQLDFAVSSIPPQEIQKYCTPGHYSPQCHVNSGDRTWYMPMTLTTPPFDDIHVRKAMNWIMDKHSLVQAWGGSTLGSVSNHIIPDNVFSNQLNKYRPYGTVGDTGSTEKAKAAMKGSKYDTKNDGMCDAPQCKNVLLVVDTRLVDTKMLPIIVADAAKIGITFKQRVVNGAYPTLGSPANGVALSERPGWGKDYADASTFFIPLFASYDIIKSGNPNYSLVGLTPKIGKAVGAVGTLTGVPSIDSQIATCQKLVDTETSPARTKCWEDLDKYTMTKVVPWIPYLSAHVVVITSKNLTNYRFDQSFTTPAYSVLSVK